MAFLKRRATGEQHSLSSSHMVGRSPGSNLCLANRLVSSRHAEILWNGSAWELRDLGSRNGTFAGDRRLESGERVTLRRGMTLAFGDAEEVFELVDDMPPNAVAISEGGQHLEAEDGFLMLPDPERPVLTIFEEGGGNWVAESNDGARRRITSGDVLDVGGQRWHLSLPVISESTWQPDSSRMVLRRVTMRFEVSRDEEHVKVALVHGNQVVALPSRAHDYLLLTLARQRLRDQEQGDLSEVEAGWIHVEELMDMLRTTETALNVSICRARQQLARVQVLGATDVIERRPRTREIRLGVPFIEITIV